MQLYRNLRNANHTQLLSELIRKSELSVLCSGWIKLPGLERLLPAMDWALEQNAAKIVVYSNFKQTLEGVSEALAARKTLTHRMVIGPKPLHTKLYYFETKGHYTAVIGSANITEGGLFGNEELSIVMTGTEGDTTYSQIQHYLGKLASLRFAIAK